MRWIGLCLLAFVPSVAWAQPPTAGFPLGQAFKAEHMTGHDLGDSTVTFTVARDGETFRGSGSAGCNRWTAQVKIGNRRLTIGPVATTRRMCGEPLMKIEAGFLSVLRSNPRWRTEGRTLVLATRPGSSVVFAPTAP